MKNNRWLPVLWATFVAIFLIAFFSIIQQGPMYIGKSYIDTSEFKEEVNVFYENIGPMVLNPIDPEELKKKIPVTQREIEEHRTRYGSLTDQIRSIQTQYEHEIEAAESSSNEEVAAVLKKERDTKIVDIQKNFEDDAHVEAKIRTEKSKVIDDYLENIGTSEQWTIPFRYKFTDVETGETFTSGNLDVPAAYKKSFNEANGLLRAGSITRYGAYGDAVLEITDLGRYYNYFNKDEVLTESAEEYGLQNVVKDSFRLYEGTVIVPKQALKEGNLGIRVANFNKAKYILYMIWILGALALATLLTKLRFQKEWATEIEFKHYYDKLKIDTKLALLLFSSYVTLFAVYMNSEHYGYYFFVTSIGVWIDRLFEFGILVILLTVTVFQLVNIVERLKNKNQIKQDFATSYTYKFWTSLQEMFLKKSIGVQTVILLVGVFLAGIGFVACMLAPVLLLVYIPAVLFVALPVLFILLRRSAYLSRIIKSTEEMAHGRLHQEIRVEGKSALATHAANLNNLREGVRKSMTEQAKSERLKTELISNVSHDLRTPLTSIITYTDLLKAEELSKEERLKYVDILDKKSQRLKTLIEDLFEVSKMASGNLELHKQRVDLTQLLQQALAEHEGEVSTSGLDFRMTFPEVPLIAHVDGKRWWRVLDNLIVNAIKYSLPGTRVYITLVEVNGNAEFVFKNITKYELGENVDELFERFKRADTSRNTDGSGLGLAIAQSIVEMHDGKMEIEVDGDLFKVSVTVPTIY
ncbi:sensor histidine kinase [Sporosarcina sp. CAU 1771]